MTEEVTDFIKESEKVSEEARKKSAEVNPNDPLNKPENATPIPDLKNGQEAINPETGKPDEASVPPDPNTGNDPNNNGQQQPQTPVTPTPQPPQPQPQSQTQSAAPMVNKVIVSASEFEPGKKSFLNPDVDKNFWDTLEGKLKEALSGNTADEIGQNMAFAALTFLFDAISNWAVHHRKEAKRIRKEYEERTKAFDDVLKNTLVEKYGAVAEFAIKHGIDVTTKEGREKLETLKKNPEFLGLCAGALSTTLMREVKPDEAGKLLEGTTKALSKGNLALDSAEVAKALQTQASQDNAAYWDKRAKDQSVKVSNLARYRAALHTARQDPANAGKTQTQIRNEVLQR